MNKFEQIKNSLIEFWQDFPINFVQIMSYAFDHLSTTFTENEDFQMLDTAILNLLAKDNNFKENLRQWERVKNKLFTTINAISEAEDDQKRVVLSVTQIFLQSIDENLTQRRNKHTTTPTGTKNISHSRDRFN